MTTGPAVRRTRPVLGLALALFLATPGRGLASPPAAPGPAGKPNLLIITIDTLRADRVSCYGGSLKTENIDRLAARGVIFRRAFAQSPTTLPSHATLFLGLTPLHHGVHDNTNFVVGAGFLTLAEHLKKAGYATAAFISGFPLDSRFGLARGFDLYDETLEEHRWGQLFYRERKAEAVLARSLEWLTTRSGPWFAWIHIFDPHHPYEPPEPFRTQFKDRLYDGEVAYVDASLKRLVDALETRGWIDDTVIVLAADHGEGLGQHGEDTHGFLAYNTTLWVPLILCAPGLRPARVDQVGALVDVFPTACELLGLPTPPGLDGVSLGPAARGRKLANRPVYFEAMFPYYSRGWAPIYGFLEGPEKFIESPIPESYDLGGDFDELKNLIPPRDPASLRTRLARVTGGLSPTDKAGQEKRLDREAQEKLRSLGYVSSPQPVRKTVYGPEDDVKTLLPFHLRCQEAQTLFDQGRVAEAVDLLKHVLTEREDFDGAYATLGTIYALQGRVADGLAVLRRGLEVLPSNYMIASPLVHMLVKMGRFGEAIDVITAGGRYPFENVADSWNMLGEAYLNTGQLDSARKALAAALDLDERDYLIFRNLGDVEFADFTRIRDQAAYERALECYGRAIELNPRDPSSRNALGFSYLQGGRAKEAIPQLQKAVELFPDYDTAIYNLGLAYFQTGEYAKSLENLVRFREKSGSRLKPAELQAVDTQISECRARLGIR
jgi:arylsulfatase A-like enzyme/tetratricopeptide (TPR) repeat protein